MPQQPARAKLGAKTALVARAAADPGNLLPILPPAADHDVVVGQHDHSAGRLIDQGVVILFEIAHHHAADDVVGVGNGRPAGRRDALGQRHAHGNPQRYRLGHGAGDGEVFLGDGLLWRPGRRSSPSRR